MHEPGHGSQDHPELTGATQPIVGAPGGTCMGFDHSDEGQPEGEELEPPEALQEAESELGINEWIDPDTGGPAEDNVPRIEDH